MARRNLAIVEPTVADARRLVGQAKSRLRPAKGRGSIQGGAMLLSAASLEEYCSGRRGTTPLDHGAALNYNRLKKALRMSQEEYDAQY